MIFFFYYTDLFTDPTSQTTQLKKGSNILLLWSRFYLYSGTLMESTQRI